MEPASTALAAVATVDLCIKYGKNLVRRYRSFRDADKEICELILQLEDTWIKTEIQVSFLQRIWLSLPGRYQLHLHTLLAHFNTKLNLAASAVDTVIGEPSHESAVQDLASKKGSINRLNVALKKKTLIETIDDCRKWQQLFDPSWYLMLRMMNPAVDHELHASDSNEVTVQLKAEREILWQLESLNIANVTDQIFKEPDFDIRTYRRQLPYSSSLVSIDPQSGLQYIIDNFRPPRPADLGATRAAIASLARLLQCSGGTETTGLLSCAGIVDKSAVDDRECIFELAFGVPKELRQPRNLRQLFLERDQATVSLNDRFRLARTLIRSVLSLHTRRWVHKNIRPETTILFEDHKSSLAGPFLVGFETFRPLDSRSYLLGDMVWEKNLYRHPRRQGFFPEEEYRLQHDVYSLGICLLELGLWRSFVVYNPEPSPASFLDISSTLEIKGSKKKAFEIQKIILEIARSQLAASMGHRYTDIVIACLTCLDSVTNTFGFEKDLVDDDGLVVGVQFIEKILFEIEKVTL